MTQGIRGGRGVRPRWVAAVWAAGFAEGAAVHAYQVGSGGLHAYAWWPVPSQVLFHALLVLDPLAAVLVARARPTGVWLGAGVMAADLTANWWANWDDVLRRPLAYLQGMVGLPAMTLFGLFVFVTAAPLRQAFLGTGPALRRP